ncbi:MAG TPA: AAA family ATPase, partial [Acidimicrobiales bacterium]
GREEAVAAALRAAGTTVVAATGRWWAAPTGAATVVGPAARRLEEGLGGRPAGTGRRARGAEVVAGAVLVAAGRSARHLARLAAALEEAAAALDLAWSVTPLAAGSVAFVAVAEAGGEERVTAAVRHLVADHPEHHLRAGIATGRAVRVGAGGAGTASWWVGPAVRDAVAAAAAAPPGHPPAALARPTAPRGGLFVGRTAETTALGDAWSRAKAGAYVAVDVVGPAGIGKSALVDRARSEAAPAELRVKGSELSRLVPHRALGDGLRRLAGIPDGSPPRAAGDLLVAAFGSLAPDALPWAPLVARLVGAEVDPTPESAATDEAFVALRAHQAVADLVAAAARAAGALWLEVDDLHWLDDASVAALRQVLGGLHDLGCLVVVTRRPGTPVLWPDGGPPAVAVELGGLSWEDVDELARAAEPAAPLTDDELRHLTRRTGGNPLFVAELLAAGARRPDLPGTLGDAVAGRLAELDDDDRRLVADAAVLGVDVDTAELAAVLGDPEVTTWRRWVPVAGLARWEAGRAVFDHDVVREVAYSLVPPARRRALHGRVADVAAATGDPDAAGPVAHHLERAGRWAEVGPWARRAAERARERG